MEKIGIEEYNGFCRELRAGNILYNTNSTNHWGEYLLVVHVTHVKDTYAILLMGMEKTEGQYRTRNLCVSLTPDNMKQVPFLKHVGYCKFTLTPILDNVHVDVGLATVYSQTDLHKFVTNLSIKKPRTRKYGKDGRPIIKKNSN